MRAAFTGWAGVPRVLLYDYVPWNMSVIGSAVMWRGRWSTVLVGGPRMLITRATRQTNKQGLSSFRRASGCRRNSRPTADTPGLPFWRARSLGVAVRGIETDVAKPAANDVDLDTGLQGCTAAVCRKMRRHMSRLRTAGIRAAWRGLSVDPETWGDAAPRAKRAGSFGAMLCWVRALEMPVVSSHNDRQRHITCHEGEPSQWQIGCSVEDRRPPGPWRRCCEKQ